VAFLIALFSAALYGAADFLGGLSTRRATVTSVVAVAQGTGFVLLLLALPLLPPASPAISDLLWGVGAGFGGGIGVALLYRALAVGTMALVAPVSAVCAVIIPVTAGFFGGERLRLLTLIGICIALLSIVLVSQARATPSADRAITGDRPRGLGMALFSGIAIGIFYLCLAHARPEAEMWPLLAARATSSVLFVVGGLATGTSLVLPRQPMRYALIGGALDMVANALYVIAVRIGPLGVVVTLVSLYPASTVVMARAFLGERFSTVQGLGIVCALAAVVLIVAST
jgi:drug/metabolite transporter (DMT)-like permease